MGKSALFSRLSRVFTRLDHERRARQGVNRRELLHLTALAGASVALGACGADLELTSLPSEPTEVRVAVVGAGLAGLHAAYRLKQAGIDVAVFEAAARVGGRTFTVAGLPDEQVVELGGELIDTSHTAMFALAEEFELTLDDRLKDPPAVAEVWWIEGNAVPEATIVEQFTSVAERLLADLEAADEDEDSFALLDETTLADYLDAVVPKDELPELHAVLTAAYRGEFGRETPEQSALNLIYLIGSDEPDPFRIFGESDERYHLHEGSQAIATALWGELGDRVRLEHLCRRLEPDGERTKLTFGLTDGSETAVIAEHVVLALPFSILRGLKLDIELSEQKRDIIATLGYGTNAKVMGTFSERVWRTEHDASGAVTSDLPFQQTWDSSLGQPGKHGVLTNFLGGKQGEDVGDVNEQAYFEGVVEELEAVFPGVAAKYVEGSAKRMHWPSAPFARGSYTCYRPGQWAFWQLEGEREGNVHFCGEHTSPDFQGWMEGAAETGAFAAAEILNDLNVAYPAGLAAILAEKLPQPTWGLEEASAERRSPLRRRRALKRSRSATG